MDKNGSVIVLLFLFMIVFVRSHALNSRKLVTIPDPNEKFNANKDSPSSSPPTDDKKPNLSSVEASKSKDSQITSPLNVESKGLNDANNKINFESSDDKKLDNGNNCKGKPICSDQEKTMIACIQDFENGSNKITLVVQNEGDKDLKVNITSETSTNDYFPVFEIPGHKTEKVNITLSGDKITKVILNAGNGDCELQINRPNPKNVDTPENGPAKVKDDVDPAKVKDVDHPAKVKDADNPAKVKDDVDPAKVKDADDPAKVKDADDPAKVKDVDDPSKSKEVNDDPLKSKEINDDPSTSKDTDDPSTSKDVHDPSKSKEVNDPSKSKDAADPSKSKDADDLLKSKDVNNPSKSKVVNDDPSNLKDVNDNPSNSKDVNNVPSNSKGTDPPLNPTTPIVDNPISQNNILNQLTFYSKQVTPIYGAYIAFLVALIIGGSWALCTFKNKKTDNGIPYQELEMRVSQSSNAIDVETGQGWDQDWDDDDWDEDNAIRSPGGGVQTKSISSNGLTSRATKKDGCDDDWDD